MSEVSVHGQVAPRNKWHRGRAWEKGSCSGHGSQETQRGGDGGGDTPFQLMSQWPASSQASTSTWPFLGLLCASFLVPLFLCFFLFFLWYWRLNTEPRALFKLVPLLIKPSVIGFRVYFNLIWPHLNSITSVKNLIFKDHTHRYHRLGLRHKGHNPIYNSIWVGIWTSVIFWPDS